MTVDVMDVVADDVMVDEAVVVAVDVSGYVLTVDVAVVVSVVKSHFVYPPACHNPIARFKADAVAAHFAYGEPLVESFKKPDELHCTVPKSDAAYGTTSTMTLFKSTAPALHFVLSSKRSML